MRDAERPSFDVEQAHDIVKSLYGLSGVLNELPSERDQNFHLIAENGKEYVLKIAAASEMRETLDMQNSAMDHLSNIRSGFNSPDVGTSVNGLGIETIESVSGKTHYIRVVSYLLGNVLARVNPHSPELLVDYGRFIGSISQGLVEFDHSAAHRDFYWDLQNANSVIKKYKDLILDSEKKKLVEYFLNLFDTLVVPRVEGLRVSVIHNDANDYNVIVNHPHDTKSRSFGILDFGDMVYSQTINEIAVAIAYAVLDKPDPLGVAQRIVSGYHAIFPLQETELDVLFPLFCARLAMSVSIAAHQQQLEPENEYLGISQEPAWKTLALLREIHPRFASYCLRAAAGLEPCRNSSAVVKWIKKNSRNFGSPIGTALDSKNSVIIDVSVGSVDVTSPHHLADHQAFGALVTEKLKDAGVNIGIGRYNEARLIYSGDQYLAHGDESRTVHLAIDLFVESGTPLLTVHNGIVHSFKDNALPYDNGPTIVIEHPTTPDGPPFYILYSHMTRDSLDGLFIGKPVKKGEQIGKVGVYPDNGGWPPHLHFQLIVDMMGEKGDLYGVAPQSKHDAWLSICPDPNLILRIPESLFPEPALTRDEILELRSEYIGRPLGVSYSKPLTIVRAFMQYLYDENGRRYLDIRNNVPQVGHSNPRIVKALSQQAAVLNTNTRYLHENLVRYAKRLTAKLPKELSVCFFVNSGSEANELALRLARTHTKQKDIIAIDGAYHGNTAELVNISSYKHDGPGGEGAPPHVHVVRMPDTYRGEYKGSNAGKMYAEDVLEATQKINGQGKGVAAFICEPLMGCGGQIIFPKSYLKEAFKHVRKAGGVCIVDEIQVGFGRMGDRFWGFETQGVVPDIVTMGKPIGNGHPIGAVVTTREITESFTTGMEFFSTTGGNTVSCAVGMAVLDEIENEKLQHNAKKVGAHLLKRLRDLMKSHPIIGDVRGWGLFIGVELVKDRETLQPAKEETKYIVERLRDLGLLISLDGPLHNVLKIKPPLVFTTENADRLVDTLDMVLNEDPVVHRFSHDYELE
ncbi:MAG: aminotransferase class III-fold pyridoxal phosphate-dependent enzyme [Candidatus Thorarchaeota archaeon]|nr:aminotransferase class III-fold pyridoxal phosphate-dependent enzyme [Candidatus Thorarchaeota archaeon]